MKICQIILILMLGALFIANCDDKGSNPQEPDGPVITFTNLTGPYLGQDPPGMSPVIFAPGTVSNQSPVHSSAIFSPDGNEVYWTVMNEPDPMQIVFMKQVDGLWTEPQTAPFSGSSDDANPFFSANGDTLYFKSYRGGGNSLWKTVREGDGWSAPGNLGSPFRSSGLGWQASITKEGTIYFVKSSGGFGTNNIYRAEQINGRYSSYDLVAQPVNSSIDDWQVFVNPDEEYIIFGRYQQPDPSFENGLYISFQKQDGTWSEPVNMGSAINGEHGASWPCVSPDRNYFFFVSDMDNGNWHYNVYWMDAQIIEDLKPADLN